MEVPFQEKISPKSTARQHTLPGGSVRSIALSLIYIVADTICIAKSLVAAGLARRALVQLSYAIGVAEPLSIYVDTYGTGKKTDEELVEIIRNNWDLRPGIIGMCFRRTSIVFWLNNIPIVQQLDLQRPQYLKTASYGHFGMLD